MWNNDGLEWPSPSFNRAITVAALKTAERKYMVIAM